MANKRSAVETDLARLLQGFFCQRLIAQRRASPRTIASYRDAFRLLLGFAEQWLGQPAATLRLCQLDAPLVVAFLDHLEGERGNSVRSRNTRLAAIHAFARYAALEQPAALPQVQRILAIPAKRFERPLVGFLSREEVEAIVEAPDPCSWSGQRDRVLLTTAYNTGARVSELIAIRVMDLEPERCTAVHLYGKGRKERVVPLWKRTQALVRGWLARLDPAPDQVLFPNRFGQPMTRSGVEKRLACAVRTAGERCPTLRSTRISPHVLRHTTAMHLLQAGVDLAVIALWLGHESVTTTHHYLEASLQMKRQALERLQEPDISALRFQPTEDVLAFLDSL